jgi:hypothetical protein
VSRAAPELAGASVARGVARGEAAATATFWQQAREIVATAAFTLASAVIGIEAICWFPEEQLAGCPGFRTTNKNGLPPLSTDRTQGTGPPR